MSTPNRYSLGCMILSFVLALSVAGASAITTEPGNAEVIKDATWAQPTNSALALDGTDFAGAGFAPSRPVGPVPCSESTLTNSPNLVVTQDDGCSWWQHLLGLASCAACGIGQWGPACAACQAYLFACGGIMD
jgi:hypothetical protein